MSLARALKSPLFSLGDEVLIEMALLQRAQHRPWFDLLQQIDVLPVLQGLGARLLRWKHWVDTLPPHDALDAIYNDGDVLARFVAAAPPSLRESVYANLQALLMAALQVGGGRYATPYAFVRALKAGGVPAPVLADAKAVRLLTVHGAKGLEASVVLLLDTDAQAQSAHTMSVLLDWPGEAAQPRSFIFLASESRVPPSVREALALEQVARQREELNTLYVALTRAKQRLVLSSAQPHRSNELSWWQRLQPLCTPEQAADTAESVSAHELAVATVPIVLPVLPRIDGEAKRAEMPDLRDVQEVQDAPTPQALVGQAMHRLLEWAPLDVRPLG